MMLRLLIPLLLFVPLNVAAEWVITPSTVVNGGVAMLRWTGENPIDVAVARYDDKTFFLDRDEQGMFALVGVDVLREPGAYPVRIAARDRAGHDHFRTLELQVVDAERKVDHLTLPPEMVTPKDPRTLSRIARESDLLQAIFEVDSGPYAGGNFRRPVPDPVSSDFGTRRILNGEPKAPHSGTDFRSPLGRMVRAAAHGTVVFAGDLYYTGRTVILDHGGGIFSLYAHLLKPLCRTGQELEAGQPLGKVGSTGRSTGAHLHWTVKIRGAKVDPLDLLARYGAERP